MKEKGITLISLAITVVVILIIAGISIRGGTTTVSEVTDQVLTNELNIISQKALSVYSEYTITKDEEVLIGKEKQYNEIKEIIKQIEEKSGEKIKLKVAEEDTKNAENKYYEVTPEEMRDIGIENCKYTYIINYATGEVINKDILVTKEGKALYVYVVDLLA